MARAGGSRGRGLLGRGAQQGLRAALLALMITSAPPDDDNNVSCFILYNKYSSINDPVDTDDIKLQNQLSLRAHVLEHWTRPRPRPIGFEMSGPE